MGGDRSKEMEPEFYLPVWFPFRSFVHTRIIPENINVIHGWSWIQKTNYSFCIK